MHDQLARRTFKEFIIEAGAGELDPNFGWNSFFTIESNDTATIESEVTFLEATFGLPGRSDQCGPSRSAETDRSAGHGSDPEFLNVFAQWKCA